MDYSRRDIAALVGVGIVGMASQATAQSLNPLEPFVPGDVTHRRIKANGINLHIAEQGTGPLVLLCHGFPESWYSWRRQLPVVAKAGFHAVAPDMRGYGQSDAPPDISAYSIMDLVGDMVALVAALGEKQAIIVGHDWGATVAWDAALIRPDLFTAVAAMSVPFRQRGQTPPLRALRQQGLNTYYQIYYQDVGVAEAEYDRDPRTTLRKTFYSLSGDAPRGRPPVRLLQPGKGALDNLLEPEHLPSWLSEADLDYMTADIKRTGFRPGLNWYRNVDRNWEMLAPWAGAVIQQRALFIAGTEDHVIHGPTGTAKFQMDGMATAVPKMERQLLIEGAGHYIQQERPKEVNEALIQFLQSVKPR